MQLILADILLPKDMADTWLRGLSLPGLEALMQRSRRGQSEFPVAPNFQRITPAVRALLRHSGYPVCADRAALAPLLMLADGLTPGDKIWHVVSPVHYALARDHVVLGQAPISWEQEQDWRALAHIATDILTAQGGQLITNHAQRWYWCHPLADTLLSSLPERALGRNVDIWMPAGNDSAARFWRRLHNELQMSWHEHDVNQKRAEHGLLVANGLWLYGSGALPQPLPGPVPTTVKETLPLIQQGLQRWGSSSPVYFIDALSPAYQNQNPLAWRSTLQELDCQLFQPLAQAHNIHKVTLCGEHSYREYPLAQYGSWLSWFMRLRQFNLANYLSV